MSKGNKCDLQNRLLGNPFSDGPQNIFKVRCKWCSMGISLAAFIPEICIKMYLFGHRSTNKMSCEMPVTRNLLPLLVFLIIYEIISDSLLTDRVTRSPGVARSALVL